MIIARINKVIRFVSPKGKCGLNSNGEGIHSIDMFKLISDVAKSFPPLTGTSNKATIGRTIFFKQVCNSFWRVPIHGSFCSIH